MLKYFILFICNINVIKVTFVSIGNYPDYRQFGVNLDECGLRYVPQHTQTIQYSPECYQNQSERIVYTDYSVPRKSNLKRKYESIDEKRIYKGVDVLEGESSWTVFLAFMNASRLIRSCTGSLITFEWVITAAHCFNGLYGRLLVSSGTNEPRMGHTLEAMQASLVINVNYTRQGANAKYDMAIIRLMGRFPRVDDGTNYLLNTICLPAITDNNQHEENVTVFGYGLINPTERAQHLQRTDMILEVHLTWYVLVVSTDGDVPTTCHGDSGGPLVQYMDDIRNRAVLVATVKSGGPQGRECGPDVEWNKFIPVFKNIEWILQAIRDG